MIMRTSLSLPRTPLPTLVEVPVAAEVPGVVPAAEEVAVWVHACLKYLLRKVLFTINNFCRDSNTAIAAALVATISQLKAEKKVSNCCVCELLLYARYAKSFPN